MAYDTKLEAIVAGVTYDIDTDSEFIHEANNGFGLPPVKRLTQKAPLQHGETDLGFVLQARTIDLTEWVLANTWATHFEERKSLMEIFKPSDEPILLRWTLGDEIGARQIDVYTVGGLTFPSTGIKGTSLKDVVRLTAPDPIFYDPVEKSVLHTLTGVSDLVFPITFPIQFAAAFVNEGAVIGYQGTWRTYPTLVFTGPGTNPIVQNLTTGRKIALNYALAEFEVVTVDLTPGYKSVTNDVGDNLIGTLTDDSDIGSFALLPSPEVSDGDNNVKFTITSGTPGETSLEMRWYDRFIGV
jgi:hypothetical protein